MKSVNNTKTIEYGDYQTPSSFATAVCNKLSDFYKISADAVIEPTFGIGNFFDGVFSTFSSAHSFFGIEVNEEYFAFASQRIQKSENQKIDISLFNEDIFAYDFSNIKENISRKESLLIIGNPPWATNSQLSSLRSANLPLKSNFKGLSGLDALTGKGNFDIAEYIILQLLSEFRNYNCTLAMLCKTIVAKNIVRDLDKYDFSVSFMDLFTFDAKEIFGVTCDAGLFVIQLGEAEAKTCTVYDFETNKKLREFGWSSQAFYSNIQRDSSVLDIDGRCPFEWRQGIKHDCSKVMELQAIDTGVFQNGIGGVYSFQLGQYVYPLVKSSDIKSYTIRKTRKYAIVPQRFVNEDTGKIQHHDPCIWKYLQTHEDFLSARRSVIYKKAPKYSIFGVGEYSFAKYKIGISGFYKEPTFALIYGDIPIMLDDTCYFLGFELLSEATITLALLNSPICLEFLRSVAFLDSKRPYTKEILKRIDLYKLSNLVDFDYVSGFVASNIKDMKLLASDYERYKDTLSVSAQQGKGQGHMPTRLVKTG